MVTSVDDDHTVTFLVLDPLPPGVFGLVTSRHDETRPLCVTHARAIVAICLHVSWLGRLLRRLPVVGPRLRARDDARHERASDQLRIDHVAVGNFQSYPDKLDELPLARPGSDISVQVTNTGDEPIAVNVLVEGRLV